MNRDAKPDLAITNATANTVSVLKGNGDGSFQTKTDYATGAGSWSVASGDLNGDQIPDLVTANSDQNTFSVLLGNGDGTYQPKLDTPTGQNPMSLALGDINRDGRFDVVTANANDSKVSVLLGNGDGSFKSKLDYGTGSSPQSISLDDVNGDQSLDVVTANLNGNTVSVLRGNGNGTFQTKLDYATGLSPRSIVVGDVNGDHKPDLVVANYAGNSVSVLRGNGDGTFQAKVDFATGANPWSVTLDEVNGDNKPDLIVADYAGNTVSLLRGNGDGTFQGKVDYATGSNPTSAVVRDLNGDHKPDLVTANSVGNTVSVILNTSTFSIFPADLELGAAPSFATVQAGLVSPPQAVSLQNHGDAALAIAYIQATGDFTADHNCPGSLPGSGGNCSIQLRFAPTTAGVRNGLLSVYSESPSSPHTLTLTGLGAVAQSNADLALSMSATPNPAFVGGLLHYELTVNNLGPEPSSGVQIIATLPAGTDYVYASPNCNLSANQLVCNVGELGPFTSTTMNVKVSPTSAGTVVNTVKVVSATADSNPSNNTAEQTSVVEKLAKKDRRGANLGITLTGTKIVKVNQSGKYRLIKYRLIMTNKGPASVEDLLVTATLPPNARLISAPGCVQENSLIVCRLGALGKKKPLKLPLTLSYGSQGIYVLTAQVHATLGDPIRGDTAKTIKTKVMPVKIRKAGLKFGFDGAISPQ